jgi:hypothetical protein
MVNGPCQLSRQSSFSAAVSPAGLCECKFASSRTVLALERLESVASSCTMALPVPWCLSRRARRDYRLGEVRRALPEGGGFPQPNTGGSSGGDAGPRGKRLVRKKPPAHRVNQKPPGASDADATRAYLAGENQIRCATSGIRRRHFGYHQTLPPRSARPCLPRCEGQRRTRALRGLPGQTRASALTRP